MRLDFQKITEALDVVSLYFAFLFANTEGHIFIILATVIVKMRKKVTEIEDEADVTK